MAGLPKSIIKKYGVSKKAWKVFKSRKSKKIKTRSKTMARRRIRRRASTRVRARRRRSYGGGKVKLIQPDAMLYGAGRGFISSFISPLTNMIPGGFITDEMGMGIFDYFVAKNTGGTIKKAALKGLSAENVMFAQSLVTGGLSLGGATTQTTNLLG